MNARKKAISHGNEPRNAITSRLIPSEGEPAFQNGDRAASKLGRTRNAKNTLAGGNGKDNMSPQMPSAVPVLPVDPRSLLTLALDRHTQRGIAEKLNVSTKTVGRWERGETRCPSMVAPALRDILKSEPTLLCRENLFTFIDLFAGIGGIRLGFQDAGGQCVFTSEWNDWSKKTYLENFGGEHPFIGDIVSQVAEEIPDHDLLLGGFPCQPFSLAGVSKKNALGRPHGFECTTQGTLFFDVARIIAAKRPKAFLLENVKNLLGHSKGETFKVVLQTLKDELGYDVHYKVIDAQPWVPQHRERILIVGFREKAPFSWDDMVIPKSRPTLSTILHSEDGSEEAEEPFTVGPKAKVHGKYGLTEKLWSYLQAYAQKHREAGNGFGFGLVKPENVARTLSARYYKDGSEILVYRGKGKTPRRLTPRECARLMGYPDTYKIPVSDTQAYRQFGNSVVVPVIREVARIMTPHILASKEYAETGVAQQLLFG
jgi:DNA (cytosine-5)-methyltransferase 1